VDELTNFLKSSFPQLNPLDRYFSTEEIAAFVDAPTGEFPQPQFVNTLVAVSDDTPTTDSCGVVLIGDAAHAFPPDLGQGVNSALEDVTVLGRCLDSYTGPKQLSMALAEFQRQRLADIKSLCALVSFAYPYQYNQDMFRKNLYLLNFALRMALSRVLPAVFDPPATLMVGDVGLTYSEVLRRAHRTTLRLKLLVAGLVAPLVFQVARYLLILSNNFLIKLLFRNY
jgi:2-polyprenyl-6-methoxyphenol hydroxylase-like FAD-dependent oxidoreductase